MSKKDKKFPWYSPKSNFFTKDYLYYYSKTLTPERTKKEVNFIEKNLGLKPGMKILDLACGHGRHAIELARRGYQLTGQDINPFFLKEAEKAARKAKVKINWIKRDMRVIPFKEGFDIALNLFSSFGYFKKEEDHQKVICEVAKAIKPKGKFFLDVYNREYFISHYRSKERESLDDGSVIVIERNFDFITSRNYEQRKYFLKNGKKKDIGFNVRVFTLYELISLCQKAGLKFKKVYGNYKGEPISFNTKRCILITQKV